MTLNNRKDKRSLEKFSRDLKLYHKIEDIWSKIQASDWINKNLYERVETIPFGSDSEGEVWDSNKSKRTSKPDYIYKCYSNNIIQNIKIIEIKAHPSYKKYPYFTYKTSSFKNTIKHNGSIVTPLGDYKLVYSPRSQKYILNNFSEKIYHGFSPNNPAVRIQQKEMNNLISEGIVKKIHWHPLTLKEIDKYKEVLFK